MKWITKQPIVNCSHTHSSIFSQMTPNWTNQPSGSIFNQLFYSWIKPNESNLNQFLISVLAAGHSRCFATGFGDPCWSNEGMFTSELVYFLKTDALSISLQVKEVKKVTVIFLFKWKTIQSSPTLPVLVELMYFLNWSVVWNISLNRKLRKTSAWSIAVDVIFFFFYCGPVGWQSHISNMRLPECQMSTFSYSLK